MPASPRISSLTVAMAVALLASACQARVAGSSPSSSATPAPSAVPSVAPTATLGAKPDAVRSSSTPASSPVAVASSGAGATPSGDGRLASQVIGSGSYPGWTVVIPNGWSRSDNGYFIHKIPGPGSLVAISVWDVGRVPRDSCHWQGSLSDPGPSVPGLVSALAAQSPRHATKPTSVTLAGYSGQYLEWSVPGDMTVTGTGDFKGCDVSDGHLDFVSWKGNGTGERYEQVAGQVDRLWVLDVKGQRLVVDATYTPDTTRADLRELVGVAESLRFDTR
jgi:hypothetical protein